jgi:predicted RNase H-like HicB family nuclease
MLTAYIRAAMRQARYDILEGDGSFYGHIPATPGVWAKAKTLEACREELQEVLEDWLTLGLRLGHPVPEFGGIRVESGKTYMGRTEGYRGFCTRALRPDWCYDEASSPTARAFGTSCGEPHDDHCKVRGWRLQTSRGRDCQRRNDR